MIEPMSDEELEAIREQVERDLDNLRAIAPAGREFREPHPAMVTAQEAAALLATIDDIEQRSVEQYQEHLAAEQSLREERDRLQQKLSVSSWRQAMDRAARLAVENASIIAREFGDVDAEWHPDTRRVLAAVELAEAYMEDLAKAGVVAETNLLVQRLNDAEAAYRKLREGNQRHVKAAIEKKSKL